MPIRSLAALCSFLLSAAAVLAATQHWHGYDRREFQVEGVGGYVVLPRIAAPGNPWLWRGRISELHPEPALGLLSKGFHVACYDLPDAAVGDRFYRYVTSGFGLSPKVSLETAGDRGAHV